MARADVGIAAYFVDSWKRPPRPPWVILLDVNVSIPNAQSAEGVHPLLLSGDALAHSYQVATSQANAVPSTKNIIPGQPLLFVDFERDENVKAPKPFRVVDLGSVVLWHHWLRYRGTILGLWLQRRQSDAMVGRAIRVYLVRRHAEVEALRNVLHALASRQIEPKPRSNESELLQRYLLGVNRRLKRLDRKGVSLGTRRLAEVAESICEEMMPGEQDALLSKIEAALRRIDVRPNILTDTLASAKQVHITEINMGDKVNVDKVNVINAQGSSGIIAVEVAIGSIKESFNQVVEKANDDLKVQLDSLQQHVSELAKQLPERSDELARDFDSFVKEATAQRPRSSYLEVTSKGLIEAANTAAALAAPITSTVQAIIGLVTNT